MDRTQLRGLLQALHPDSRQAAAHYRELHERLVRFFRLNHAMDPEDLADTVLDRLARRLATEVGQIESVHAFALGIARRVLQEEARHQQREEQAAREWSKLPFAPDPLKDALLDAVEDCMQRLAADARHLLQDYYAERGRAKIEAHRDLAEGLGLTANALRNRLLRARRLLDGCLRERHGDVFGLAGTSQKKRSNR